MGEMEDNRNGNGFSLNRRKLLKVLSGGVILFLSDIKLNAQERGQSGSALSVDAPSKYTETIAVLESSYREEIRAHLSYSAYAPKAIAENYPNIAHLFSSFAVSESIHAEIFKKLLSDLGAEAKETPKPEINISATKENLNMAAKMELWHIDQFYPQSIEKAKLENHEGTIGNLNYAWETEKQHRGLLKKIQLGTGILFKLLAKKFEETPAKYFVCQVCGSTLTELPKDVCPICKVPVSQFKEVERIR